MLTKLEMEAVSTEDAKFDKFLEMEMYMTGASSNDIQVMAREYEVWNVGLSANSIEMYAYRK